MAYICLLLCFRMWQQQKNSTSDNQDQCLNAPKPDSSFTNFQELLQKEQEIQELKQTIHSIIKQYEELQTVAKAYRAEAAKWYGLYIKDK